MYGKHWEPTPIEDDNWSVIGRSHQQVIRYIIKGGVDYQALYH